MGQGRFRLGRITGGTRGEDDIGWDRFRLGLVHRWFGEREQGRFRLGLITGGLKKNLIIYI